METEILTSADAVAQAAVEFIATVVVTHAANKAPAEQTYVNA